MCQTVKCK